MTEGTTRRYNDGEVLSGVQRRRRWKPEEKIRIVEETYLPGMGHVATTRRITAEDVKNLMVATVEHRYGQVNRVPEPIECLTDNGSCYTARDTRSFAHNIGLVPLTTPVSSPQSNGMAEAFVRTLKRDYVRVNPRPDARTAIDQLPGWIAHYNEVHPHRSRPSITPRVHRENPRGPVRPLGGTTRHGSKFLS
jgi:putative transposase